ncbi:MAG TPA: hemolysin III family protein [Baekduia sp.]|uniref:PAQR family membrane homeostasis protein TrhA n=1 Tax=Baekduia sp. TaxID=2600305 RepID=UPI002D7A1A91|nr:hemolysin III family protein [Baekduia sp.]HET6509634.1 hemolysin III family protein [Baekduia sp.]
MSRTAAVIDEDLRPLLRGMSHAYAFWVALVAAVVLTAMVPSGTARVGAAVYGIGLCGLFAASGTYHRWRWDPRWRPLLRRIDHSTIFVFIAASYTPVALLAMHGTLRWVILGAVWAGAVGGVTLSVAWIDAPRALQALLYVALGWTALVAMPQLIDALDVAPLLLLALGGVLYSLGAVVYATQRPDPWPRVFGFHEVFHALVILAAAAQFTALAGWVFP